MKRNWETIREILLATEKLGPNETAQLQDYDESQYYEISYHAQLLENAGLVKASISKTIGPYPKAFHIYTLTWEGHEFLDSIRANSTWEKVKSIIMEKGGVMTFDVIKTAAATLVKSAIQ